MLLYIRRSSLSEVNSLKTPADRESPIWLYCNQSFSNEDKLLNAPGVIELIRLFCIQ